MSDTPRTDAVQNDPRKLATLARQLEIELRNAQIVTKAALDAHDSLRRDRDAWAAGYRALEAMKKP